MRSRFRIRIREEVARFLLPLRASLTPLNTGQGSSKDCTSTASTCLGVDFINLKRNQCLNVCMSVGAH